MWRWCASWSGVVLIAVGLAAVPSVAVVESYVGGSAVHGSVADGRYFVNPGHGRPIAEVSALTWRTAYWVERLWPLSALLPGLTGLFLSAYGKGPDWRSPPPPPQELPPWVLWACLLSGLGTVAATWLCWVLTRTPWVVMLAGWVLCCVSTGTVTWVYARSSRPQSSAEPGAAPDPARR